MSLQRMRCSAFRICDSVDVDYRGPVHITPAFQRMLFRPLSPWQMIAVLRIYALCMAWSCCLCSPVIDFNFLRSLFLVHRQPDFFLGFLSRLRLCDSALVLESSSWPFSLLYLFFGAVWLSEFGDCIYAIFLHIRGYFWLFD